MKESKYLQKMRQTISEIDKVEQELYEEERRRELKECQEIAEKIRREEEDYG